MNSKSFDFSCERFLKKMEERGDEGENRGVERLWEMTTMMTDEGRIKKLRRGKLLRTKREIQLENREVGVQN